MFDVVDINVFSYIHVHEATYFYLLNASFCHAILQEELEAAYSAKLQQSKNTLSW